MAFLDFFLNGILNKPRRFCRPCADKHDVNRRCFYHFKDAGWCSGCNVHIESKDSVAWK
jgi:hypothetical protein